MVRATPPVSRIGDTTDAAKVTKVKLTASNGVKTSANNPKPARKLKLAAVIKAAALKC